MLSFASVGLLDIFKIDDNNPNCKGPPRCHEHQITCQLVWYRYKHAGDKDKAVLDPNFKIKKTLHQHFFWTCGLQPRKSGGIRCDFIQSADTNEPKAKMLEQNYLKTVIQIQRTRLAKEQVFYQRILSPCQ